jgi:hypothetical protein
MATATVTVTTMLHADPAMTSRVRRRVLRMLLLVTVGDVDGDHGLNLRLLQRSRNALLGDLRRRRCVETGHRSGES